MSLKPIQLKFAPQGIFVPAVIEFTEKYLDVVSVRHATRVHLTKVLENLLNLFAEHHRGCFDPICKLSLTHQTNSLDLELMSKGTPIFPENLESHTLQLLKASDKKRPKSNLVQLEFLKDSVPFKLFFENCGRLGQKLRFSIELPPTDDESSEASLAQDDLLVVDQFEIRELKSGEEEKVTDLFYKIYQYNYVNDWIYYPEEIRRMIENNEFVSLVAADVKGSLIGHIGTRIWSQQPQVIEMGTGGTDPRVKAKGAYGKIFDASLNLIRERFDPEYLFFDCVTNHDYSQRQIIKSGGIDTALFVGCPSKKTQAGLSRLGLGSDSKEMDRYSLLYVVMTGNRKPFGPEVVLPSHLGDQLGFLLEPLGIFWVPASRADYLPNKGTYTCHVNELQNSVTFELDSSGLDCVQEIFTQWHHYLREGFEYAAVDIPIDSKGLGYVQEILSGGGFFVSGFFPWRNSCRLALRMQSLDPKRVAFDHIKVFSPQAKRSLEIVRADFARNSVL